jgi:hypothetical protein
VSRPQEDLKFVGVDFYITRGDDPATIRTLAAIILLVTFLDHLHLSVSVWRLPKCGCWRLVLVAKDVLVETFTAQGSILLWFQLRPHELYKPGVYKRVFKPES